MMSPKSQPDDNFYEASLAQQLDKLAKELVSLKSRFSEKGIHDTRVQSRRMRAALDAFQDLFHPDPYQTLYGNISQITRILGKTRETGVALGLIKNLEDTGDMAEGICREYLIERISAKLQKQEKKLLRDLKEIDPVGLQSQLQSLLAYMDSWSPDSESAATFKRPRTKKRRRNLQKLFQPMLFQIQESRLERGQRIIKGLAQPILTFRPRYQFQRATDEKLHKMRISAKKLRYAMEIFSSIWPGGLKDEIVNARALQNAGGLYHDWCVLCEILKKEIQRAQKSGKEHLAFQNGRLLASAEDHKAELRKQMLPVITTLQSALRLLLPDLKNVPTTEKSLSSAIKRKKSKSRITF